MHWISVPFVAAGLATAEYRYGVDLRMASPAEALRHSRTPVLLIHGMRDRETSPENSVRLQQANPRCTQLWLVPEAGHTGPGPPRGRNSNGASPDGFSPTNANCHTRSFLTAPRVHRLVNQLKRPVRPTPAQRLPFLSLEFPVALEKAFDLIEKLRPKIMD